MSIQKEDYRTNRADYALAAKGQSAVDGGRNEILERRKKTLWLRDPRIARLAANPCESLPGPKPRPRGN
ncbi:hypothetical protein EOA60_23545 [Mesorhizobium sp. M1A.F.Ca.IN.020.06.1.1]|nr:hypothetical protein CK214_21675 [Mesorhizobium sp. WSM3882]RUU97168.1 hypothetical protein EOA79_25355 [Mesorhizobium sp. M1A.F.Ca.IN.020.03.2.1]RUV86029.1 hypothetical protein EOA51_16175 [Mesorhizobium sp. M1A.F.Ca.IN.020.32.1.1]RUW13980.1 hypothetical protein EOA46_04655 [Mesorhizobium sp. M1A.F.Ca.IN.022.05.2.1]RUW22014.1 hypothetical protein EOA60_23545 [Mesorhizobium sp. M1A.F.Ca.IN.020.06.1.1]RWF78899.1 MAG: hypothetical protein EOQ35_21820 [Mesorhizobium sp.]